MIRIRVKTKYWFLVMQIIAILVIIIGILILAAIADSVFVWILASLIVITILYFGSKNISDGLKYKYISPPLRENMVEGKIISEPTRRNEERED